MNFFQYNFRSIINCRTHNKVANIIIICSLAERQEILMKYMVYNISLRGHTYKLTVPTYFFLKLERMIPKYKLIILYLLEILSLCWKAKILDVNILSVEIICCWKIIWPVKMIYQWYIYVLAEPITSLGCVSPYSCRFYKWPRAAPRKWSRLVHWQPTGCHWNMPCITIIGTLL